MNSSKMRWVVGIIIVAALVVIIVANKKEGTQTANEPIKIGAILSLTGPAAFFGVEFKNGMDLANKKFNLDITTEDSQTNPAQGISALQKLIVSKDIDVVIPILSSVASAITPPAIEKNVVVFQSLVSSPDIAAQSPYTFRYFTSGSQEAPIMARLAVEKLSSKTASVIYQNDEYGLSYANSFKKEFESLGGKMSSMEGFLTSENDFRSILTKVKIANPDIIYIIALDKALANVIKQAREAGITSKLATNWVLAAPSVQDLTGSSDEGVYLTTPLYYTTELSQDAQSFVSDYKAAYSKDPSAYAAIGYDLVHILSLVKKSADDADHQKLIADITNIGALSGIMGDLKIDEVGEISFALYPAVIKDQVLQVLK